MFDPSEFLRLLEACEDKATRVRMFIDGTYTLTGEPEDTIPLESIYEKWRGWKARIPMPEAEFRIHLRNCRLDIFEGDDEPVLVGWKLPQGASRQPGAPRKLPNLNAALAHATSLDGLAASLGIATRTLRRTMAADPNMEIQVREGLAKNKAVPGDTRELVSPETILANRQAFNFVRKSNRPHHERLKTARSQGFDSYEDFAENVHHHKLYLIARQMGHPETQRYWEQWQRVRKELKAKMPQTAEAG